MKNMEVHDLNYRLKVTVLQTENPTVMRQLSVPATINFHDLHLIIQTAFSWGQCHNYKFTTARKDGQHSPNQQVIELDPIFGVDPSMSSTDTLFSQILEDTQRSNMAITYEYDMDNVWNHSIELVGRAGQSTEWAVCYGGEGHPCAEDVGGPSGWALLKTAYERPYAHEATRRKEWYSAHCVNGVLGGLGGNMPYRWDRDAVNVELGRLRLGEHEEKEDGLDWIVNGGDGSLSMGQWVGGKAL